MDIFIPDNQCRKILFSERDLYKLNLWYSFQLQFGHFLVILSDGIITVGKDPVPQRVPSNWVCLTQYLTVVQEQELICGTEFSCKTVTEEQFYQKKYYWCESSLKWKSVFM